MFRVLLLCVCACVVHVCATHLALNGQLTVEADEAEPMTHSASGSFRGSWMRTRRGRRFQAYRGVRYAEPPVGALRFQPPKLILHYEGEVDAREDGPACPQEVPEGYHVSEDCLTINVYTPNNDSSKLLPVIFFIHPGGFYSMTGRSDLAGPHYLMDRDVVLVTINYRLGSLGFLALGNKLAPGNNGFKDQVIALRWVQRNVAAFGGDPDLVTIAGCSAGSISVMLHMISPMTIGLFHRAISMSAGATSKVPDPSHLLLMGKKQAKVSNCPADNTTALYECLMMKDWQDIHGSLLGFYEFGDDPLGLWLQVVEPDFGQERFLDMEPMDAIRQGRMHEVPYIVSMTTDEFYWKSYSIMNNSTLMDTMNAEWDRIAPISFLLPRNETHERLKRLRRFYFGNNELSNDTCSTDRLGKIYSDSLTAFPIHRMANLMCRHSRYPVYYSEFAYVGNQSHYEDPVTNKPFKAIHHDDLIYLFTLSYRFSTIDVADTQDSRMVDKMTAIWYNFARYGNPNPRGDTPELGCLRWPAMRPGWRQYLRIGNKFSIRRNLFEDRFKIWEQLYPIRY